MLPVGAVLGVAPRPMPAQGAEVTVRSQHVLGGIVSPRLNSGDFKGPSMLASFLYIACFVLAVPACGISRRRWNRRKRAGVGSTGGGVLDVASGVGGEGSRRGWRVGQFGGRGAEAGGHELVGLSGEEDADGSGGRDRTRV